MLNCNATSPSNIQAFTGPACRLSPRTWNTVGTFHMAEALAAFDQWREFVACAPESVLRHVMVSTGASTADFEKMKQILTLSPQLNFIFIDVANGYSEHFVTFVQKAREAEACLDKVICAGNAVTGENGGRAHSLRCL